MTLMVLILLPILWPACKCKSANVSTILITILCNLCFSALLELMDDPLDGPGCSYEELQNVPHNPTVYQGLESHPTPPTNQVCIYPSSVL